MAASYVLRLRRTGVFRTFRSCSCEVGQLCGNARESLPLNAPGCIAHFAWPSCGSCWPGAS
eukprot:scaffold952_cov249-Pinguiococcus_pyrenoidosus.AAC.23